MDGSCEFLDINIDAIRDGYSEAGVQEEVHDAITGHLGGGVGRGYGGVPLASKAKAMAKVRYDVDLSDLHVPCGWDS